MLRNLLASAIILAASASSFAGIAEDLAVEGATSSDVVNAALSACADADCKAAVLVEAIEAGIHPTSVMAIANTAGMPGTEIGAALRTANVTEEEILNGALANNMDPTTIGAGTAAGGGDPLNGTGVQNEGLDNAAEVPGISPGA